MLLGITERLEFLDALAHAATSSGTARGDRMTGNRIAIVIDQPEDLVEVSPCRHA